MKNLKKLIEDKFISVQKHPEVDLFIYNYTQKAQFDHIWTEETITCRGLIMDKEGNIVSRPFKKFFNLEEHKGELPKEPFQIFEKFDGSLGISYWIGDTPYLSTRGSFVSEQAIKGTEILRKYPCSLKMNKNYTYLFEIIYPENRIVIDYKGREDIVLLAVFDTKSGEELDITEVGLDFPITGKVEGIGDLTKLRELEAENKEGFVIRFSSGLRLKIKFAEYVRLHRLITGINARRIWDLMRNDQPFTELLERVPEEFLTWVNTTRKNLQDEFNLIECLALKNWEIIKTLPDRKSKALALMKIPEKQKCVIPIVFNLLDRKSYSEKIWKIIKPAHEVPFKKEI